MIGFDDLQGARWTERNAAMTGYAFAFIGQHRAGMRIHAMNAVCTLLFAKTACCTATGVADDLILRIEKVKGHDDRLLDRTCPV